jgi:hypothetical protein
MHFEGANLQSRSLVHELPKVDWSNGVQLPGSVAAQ